MKVKTKIFLLAIVPFLVAIAAIGIGVRMQATSLAKAQHATVESAYMSSKQAELRHYVELATSAIAPFYKSEAQSPRDDEAQRRQALAVLQNMDFGPDGYFFVYDMNGNSLMHPREPGLVGRNLWSMRDPQGALPIQELIAAAAHGGGYVRYVWHRPSTNQLEPKLGYVVLLPRWGWMIGTGIYLDGVNAALARIDESASANIQRTMMWIGAIALAGFIAIAACAVFVNVTEYRSADAKLKRLAQQVVESQEQERARLSRELHDGISQKLVSVKLLIESALARLESAGQQERGAPDAQAPLTTGLTRLADALREVRHISHALRPAMLDDLGLAAALEQLSREFGEEAGIDITFTRSSGSDVADPSLLPEGLNTALFRIAQEALANIVRHAHAAHATLALDVSNRAVALSISDDGCGFDIERVQADARGGIGLRNMRERLEPLGGTLTLASEPGRTIVTARVPLPSKKRESAPLASQGGTS